LYGFCGTIPLWAQLRDAKCDASKGTVEALEKIHKAIRKRFGRKVRILVRADSGFAREEIMAWCEKQRAVYSCFGLARNPRLLRHLEGRFEKLHHAIEESTQRAPCRGFVDFTYRTQKSWSRTPRVVGKAEVLEKADYPRLIVTHLPKKGFAGDDTKRFRGAELYEKFYGARGDMENRIKEEQMDLFADRTSTHWIASHQLRLGLSAFAHLILSVLRAEVLKGTALAQATIGQIRLKLFKIAARVKVSSRRVHFEWVSAYPWVETFVRAHKQLAESFPYP